MRLSDRYRLSRAKQRYMREPVRRTGLVATVALLLALAVVTLAIVERRSEGRQAAIDAFVHARAVDPMEAIAAGFRSRRSVILGDVSGATAPKVFAADVIAFLARGLGLDIVAVEIGADLQPVIDRYLDAEIDDASTLVANPRVLRAATGDAGAWLALYRRVWQLNRELGADRRIRVLAIDSPGWPAGRATSPARLLALLDQREAALLRTVDDHLGARNEPASILFFVDGFHSLRSAIRVETGAASSTITTLAMRLRSPGGARAFSVLVDAAPGATALSAVPAYRPARLYQLTRRASPGRTPLAIPPARDFPATAADLEVASPPGLSVHIDPRTTPLSDLIDLYIRL